MGSKKSHRVIVTAEVMVALKVVIKGKVHVRNCGTSHPPQRCPAFGKKCHSCGMEGHYKALCRSHKHPTSQQNGQRGRRPQHKVEQEENQNDCTFSLNPEEVVIQFTDSVMKVKDSRNVMFDEIELSQVFSRSQCTSCLTYKWKFYTCLR